MTGNQFRSIRFWANVHFGPECWEWMGALNSVGYGMASVDGRQNVRAHRYVAELETGFRLPPDICVCHKCDNRKCVRPSHLFLDTNVGNIRDMVRKGRQRAGRGGADTVMNRTHCPNGHDYLIHSRVNAKGHRICQVCRSAQSRRQNERRKTDRMTLSMAKNQKNQEGP